MISVAFDDDRDGSDCFVGWMPASTEVYTIRVINPAEINNTFWISTN